MKVLNANAATSTNAEQISGQTKKQTNKLESSLVKGIVERGQSASHIHLTRDNVIDNFSFT